jgi:hypothetical protein
MQPSSARAPQQSAWPALSALLAANREAECRICGARIRSYNKEKEDDFSPSARGHRSWNRPSIGATPGQGATLPPLRSIKI